MTYAHMIVENDVYPFYLSKADDEIAEERRLLYVAMTRAQVLLVSALFPATLDGVLTRCSPTVQFLLATQASQRRMEESNRETVHSLASRPSLADPLLPRPAFDVCSGRCSIGSSSILFFLFTRLYCSPVSIFKTLLTFRTPRFGRESREAITKVLGRPPVDEAAVAEAIAVA